MAKESMVAKALETNAFQSTAASAAYINPELWVRQIQDFAKAKLVMEPLGKRYNDLVGQAGDTLNVQFNAEITAAALTESTVITPSAISYTQVVYTPTEYGLAVTLTRKERIRSIQDIMMEKTRDMGYALAKLKDSNILTALDATTITSFVPNDVAVSAIASSDTLDAATIADGVSHIRGNDYDAKFLVIHPKIENALLKLSQFIDASVYGGREVVMNGEIGKYLGLRVLVTTLVPANATTSTAKNCYVLDQDSFGIAQKMNITFNSDYKVLEREMVLAAVEDFGVSVRQDDKIVRLVAYAQ